MLERNHQAGGEETDQDLARQMILYVRYKFDLHSFTDEQRELAEGFVLRLKIKFKKINMHVFFFLWLGIEILTLTGDCRNHQSCHQTKGETGSHGEISVRTKLPIDESFAGMEFSFDEAAPSAVLLCVLIK